MITREQTIWLLFTLWFAILAGTATGYILSWQ